jgi:hypothetical protein
VRGSTVLRLVLAATVPLLSACGSPAADTPNRAVLCQARAALVAARDDTERAVSAAISGDATSAQDKAAAAVSKITASGNFLKFLSKEVQASDEWKALSEANAHVASAAKAVSAPPDTDAYSPAVAQQALSSARATIAKVDVLKCV